MIFDVEKSIYGIDNLSGEKTAISNILLCHAKATKITPEFRSFNINNNNNNKDERYESKVNPHNIELRIIKKTRIHYIHGSYTGHIMTRSKKKCTKKKSKEGIIITVHSAV